MDNNSMDGWHRLEFDGTPIYIHPETPDWFVPNRTADNALKKAVTPNGSIPEIENLIKRLNGIARSNYDSRTDLLTLNYLKECWIHVTNRCNMQCVHCMFESSPSTVDELTPDQCRDIISQAYGLGCRLFYFTGGEPFISKSFFASVDTIFTHPDTHVVVLTNLTLLTKYINWLDQIPKERLHFQVSLDGLEANHDAVRGRNAFKKLSQNLDILRDLGFPVTLSTAITRKNVEEMEWIVEYAAEKQIANLHFLWLFKKGNADDRLFISPERIFSNLRRAQRRAEKKGVKIDNIESLRSQIFSCPGTRYDLSNAGWQSLAVGPNGYIYPTPALIYSEKVKCGHLDEGLENIWRNSPVLKMIRKSTLNNSETYRRNEFRYLVGGGDIDHSLIHSGQVVGGDPYQQLYIDLAKWLIVRESRKYDTSRTPGFHLKMGEKLGDCPAEGSSIFFTHSNCVLSLPGFDTHTQVNRFYSEAAKEVKEDILNPICYEEALIEHIPPSMRYRSYGCGSPVLEADIKPGQTIVDLGSGTGIECFLAGKLTGPTGRVIGIDMGDTMLSMANTAKAQVVKNLSYDNIEFKKAFLEELPIDDNSVDVVISNCVVNLSPDKRRVFQEVYRILKPNGRLIISDISYNEDIPLEIKYNETLRGECIGGALRYQDLFGLLNDIGFTDSRVEKGYLYRNIKDYNFYSITYQAVKPDSDQPIVAYDFPDFNHLMASVESEPTCACFSPSSTKSPPVTVQTESKRSRSGCMVCGKKLVYLETDRNETCNYCGQFLTANALCEDGHFVCDACHSDDAIAVIKHICLNSNEPDAVALMETIRSHPQIPVHGPEHHSMIPAIILAALKNSGEDVSNEKIISGIQRGQTIAGGACAFFGACGAALGVGIAFSVLISANPIDGEKRQLVMQITNKVIEKIAAYTAARCCQRDSYLSLKIASEILQEKLGIKLKANHPITCKQFVQNKECIHAKCPLWPAKISNA